MMVMEKEDVSLGEYSGQQKSLLEEEDESSHCLQKHPISQQTGKIDQCGMSINCVTAVVRSALCLLDTRSHHATAALCCWMLPYITYGNRQATRTHGNHGVGVTFVPIIGSKLVKESSRGGFSRGAVAVAPDV